MLLSVLFVVLGCLILDYPRKFLNKETKQFSDELIIKSKSYNYFRKFLKENSAIAFIRKVVIPISFIVGLLLIGYGIYTMIIIIKTVGF